MIISLDGNVSLLFLNCLLKRLLVARTNLLVVWLISKNCPQSLHLRGVSLDCFLVLVRYWVNASQMQISKWAIAVALILNSELVFWNCNLGLSAFGLKLLLFELCFEISFGFLANYARLLALVIGGKQTTVIFVQISLNTLSCSYFLIIWTWLIGLFIIW